MSWRWKSARRFFCTTNAGELATRNAAAAPGSFFQFLRQHPGSFSAAQEKDHHHQQQQQQQSQQQQGPNAGRPLQICSGNLRLLRPARQSRWKAYKSREEVTQFFSKMDASIKVGNILRKHGWSEASRSRIEELGIAWSPAVVLQVLRQPLEKSAAWGFFQWLKGVEDYRHSGHEYNSLIEVFGRANDVGGMQQVLDDMAAYGCGMNVVVFTTVIHWYSRAGEIEKAVEMWNQMASVGCQPNVVTYTMFMSALRKVKRFDEVGEVFRDMIAAGCKPNVRTYTVLIHCLAECGNLDAALLVFEKLDSLRATPTAATFRVLMESAAGLGNLELLEKLLHGMKRANQRPDKKMCFAVVDSLKKSGRFEEARELLREMESLVEENPGEEEEDQQQQDGDDEEEETEEKKRKGIPLQDLEVMEGVERPLVDMKSFSTVIQRWGPGTAEALEAANYRWDPWKVLRVLMGLKDCASALKFFHWVEKQPGYKHDSFVYTKMISILGRNHHYSEIDQLLLKLQSSEIQVSIVMMNSLLYSLALAQRSKVVMKMYFWMQDLRVKPDARTYTIIIDMLVKEREFDRAMQMYREMLDKGCKPDAHTYTVLITSLGREGKVDEAEDLLRKMPGYGCKPNVVNYTSLINSYVQVGRVKHALVLFTGMQEAGIKPNSVTYTTMARGLKRAKMLHELVEVEKQMSKVDFWKQCRVKSEDELLVNETICGCLLGGKGNE